MAYQFSFEHRGEYLVARWSGAEQPEDVLSIWDELFQACEATGCFSVLAVIAHAKPFSVTQSFMLSSEIARRAVGRGPHRIARVFSSVTPASARTFSETCLRNRGVDVRTFETQDVAVAWLLATDEIPSSER